MLVSRKILFFYHTNTVNLKFFNYFDVTDYVVEKVIFVRIIIIFYSLLITVFVFKNTAADDAQDFSFQLEENYKSFTGFQGRMITGYKNVKILLLDYRGESKEENKTVFSFYSPVISAGRLKKRGLLKEIQNPSYWYAGSDIYTDQSGIFEDLSFNKSGKTGITLNPSNGLCFFMMMEEDDLLSDLNEKGFSLSYSFSERLNCTLAYTKSKKKESSDENWYFERDAQYGDNIYNLGALLNYEGDIFINSLSFGISSGSCFKSGNFLRYSPEIKLDSLSLYFLISFSDSSYRKPESGYPKIKLRRGVKCEYMINRYLDAESSYNLDIFHTQYSDQIENCMGESYYLKLNFDAEYFYLILEGNRKNKTEDIILISEDSLSCKSGIRGRKYSLSGYTRFKYLDYEVFSRQLTIESSLSIGRFKLIVKNRRETSAALISSIGTGIEGTGDESWIIEERENCKISGKRVKNIFSMRISNEGGNIRVFAEAEYETLDEGSINLKSVLRLSAGSRFRY